jgi:hypothetical protein
METEKTKEANEMSQFRSESGPASFVLQLFSSAVHLRRCRSCMGTSKITVPVIPGHGPKVEQQHHQQ